MPNNWLLVGAPVLVLALAAKLVRRSLISAARRAIAKRWSSGVALMLPLGCRAGMAFLTNTDSVNNTDKR
jgi:hypothetical protein